MKSSTPLALSVVSATLLASFISPVAGASVEPRSAVVSANPADTKAAIQQEAANLASLRDELGLAAGEDVTLRTVLVDADGTRHIRLDRQFRGVPVVGGDLVVKRSPEGTIDGVIWNVEGSVAVPSTVERVTQDDAKGAAMMDAGARVEQSSTKIVYALDGYPRLAWDVVSEGVDSGGNPISQHTIVDAQTGKTLDQYKKMVNVDGEADGYRTGRNPINVSKRQGKYTLTDDKARVLDMDSTEFGGKEVFSDSTTFGDGTMSNRASVSADVKMGIEKSFDFYKRVFNRNGFDGRGTQVKAMTHVGNSWTNATWQMPDEMRIGDGKDNKRPLSALDVVAHEFSHGLTFSTAGLVYRGESGGINEAASDIIGTAVEFDANIAEDTPDYHIGELVEFKVSGQPLRWMDKPSTDGKSPDCWSSDIGRIDVHQSSGPMNHWFYLVSEGSGKKTINGVNYDSPTCNNSTVEGVGRDAATKVFYRALVTKMTSGTNYQRARDMLIESAKELYPEDERVCRSVESALDAISAPAGRITCNPAPDNPGDDNPGNPGDDNPDKPDTPDKPDNPGEPGDDNPGDPVDPPKGDSYDFVLGRGMDQDRWEQKFSVAQGDSLKYSLTITTQEQTRVTRYDTLLVTVNGMVVKHYSNLDADRAIKEKVDLSRYAGQDVTVRFVTMTDQSSQTLFSVTGAQVSGD